MRVIAQKTLRDFWKKHPQARRPLQAWLEYVQRTVWKTPSDLRKAYKDDVVLPNNRAVFNIKGNNYRLVVHIHYKSQIIFIRFIGTHKAYDKIDATTI